ncbi:CPBP family glutamic-type intramembrane protease [Paracidobacterium acidisoli]|uniref:CPBP family intramembrane metalloprotease n=1 Tax=Paracidobacterium acidisoli TaxID=2303751 RepID=A0A372IPU6_9BACT|nr:CPBP family glutamic-type intramembrane protease [Paracidobacterium acidisoli]MBT9331226.1 hypothetical protein [Paracidobacterium acidisoli]
MLLRSRAALLAEFLALFVALPVALFVLPARIPPIPLLWLWCAYCLFALLRDPAFPRGEIRSIAPLRRYLPSILILFVAAAALITLAVRLLAPQTLFDMPRTHTVLWAAIMVLYPFLSVWPQGMIYRIFVLHRYQPLLQNEDSAPADSTGWPLIFLSAASFSLIHIIFHNWIAVALTFPGGILFAWRQRQTRSHLTACFEHALYGCFLFTVGLGHYFYVRFV